jgi:FKBP-type peptidyl-prolyl cis-trans isomerase
VSKITALLISSALAVSLSGCMSSGTPEVQAFDGLSKTCESYKGGAEIDSVKVTAEKNKVPTVEFPTAEPGGTVKSALANIKIAQTKIVREGTGPAFTGDSLVSIDYAVFSSTSGQLLASNKFDGTDSAAQVFNSTDSKAYCDALSGVKQGSVVTFALPASDVDPEGSLFVLELRKVYLPYANGSANAPETGFPAVVRAPKTNQPGIVQPSFDIPKEFKRSILISGRGEKVKVNDSITVHYVGWVWTDSIGDPFDSSWVPRNAETPVSPTTFTLNNANLIPGFVKALDGVAVGSQVIAVMPPSDAYGAEGQGSIPPNSTLIFVIDVLGINK